VDTLELLERLARLCVPHVNFGVLSQLSAGRKSATADVFSRVALRELRERETTTTQTNSVMMVSRALIMTIVSITHSGTRGLPGAG
jgi:hypothetical protein